MRRQRLPTRALARRTDMVRHRGSSDLRYLEQVVTIQFPIREARIFLRRAMGNKIGLRLVELGAPARPGESHAWLRDLYLAAAGYPLDRLKKLSQCLDESREEVGRSA